MADRSLASRLWYHFIASSVRAVSTLVFQVRHTGRENVPEEGGVLVVCNHQSHLDPPLIGCGFPRLLNYLARDTLFRIKPFAKLIRSINAIPINREGSGLSGIKETLKRLRRGEAVLVFPEGTRSPNGDVQKFKPGFSTLAVRGRAAIVPAAITGAYEAWPRDAKFPRPGVIRVHFGLPILPEQVKQYDERALVEELEKRVREIHAELQA